VGIPRGGQSPLSTKRGLFEDRQADTALIDALLRALPNRIELSKPSEISTIQHCHRFDQQGR
jgi:hypothetical protein